MRVAQLLLARLIFDEFQQQRYERALLRTRTGHLCLLKVATLGQVMAQRCHGLVQWLRELSSGLSGLS